MQGFINFLIIFSFIGLMSGEITHFSLFVCAVLALSNIVVNNFGEYITRG